MTSELIETATGEQPLSKRESDRLAELEAVIIDNFIGFYRVGKALAEIKEAKLYRQDHKTFEDYVGKVWDLGRRRAYQIIDAANVVDTVKIVHQNANNCSGNDQEDFVNHGSQSFVHHGGQNSVAPLILINERQARELAKLSPEDQVTAWQRAVETAPNGKITAKHIRKCVKEVSGQSINKAIQKTRDDVKNTIYPEDRVSSEFKSTFNLFLGEINKAMLDGWKSTSHEAAMRHVEAIYNLVQSHSK